MNNNMYFSMFQPLVFFIAKTELEISNEFIYLVLASLFSGIVMGFAFLAVYASFGPNASELKDPFEEHEE